MVQSISLRKKDIRKMLSSITSSLREAFARSKPFKIGGLGEMLRQNWHLGFTAFGGPAVHFQIFHKLFVENLKWLDEQMWRELFALCQALPGPGSTKMIYCINVIRSGFSVGILAFFVWSLPGAFGAYGLALGISRVNETLPSPVYALLSGLNAATVGIVALAAVQLSQKAITDKLTRVLVFLGASAGMLYKALWYFPVLMFAGGTATIFFDSAWGKQLIRRRNQNIEEGRRADGPVEALEMSESVRPNPTVQRPSTRAKSRSEEIATEALVEERGSPVAPNLDKPIFSLSFGIKVLVFFFATFITIMILRGLLKSRPRGFDLFANLYLAGTIIFGGGPVVIPLLREYVVDEGWVSSRDFLLGLAIIQAFPGPNFNFAVYLATLAVKGTSLNAAAGALIGYIAIFSPGQFIHTGTMGLWKSLRRHQSVTSCLRGVNASAVGLVYTAVYRLWEIGYIDEAYQSGSSLGKDPWWVVITATSFVGGMWFKLPAPAAIVLGGAMGLIWYAIVKA